MLPFQFVLPGWAGSWCWKAWRQGAPAAVSPGLICFVPWVSWLQPDPALQGMGFASPSLSSSQPMWHLWSRQPMWYLPDSPCTLLPQYFSTCSLTYLTLFLRFAKHAASFKQTTDPKQKKAHSSFSWPDPNNIYDTSPVWTRDICLPATGKKHPNHPLWETVVKLRHSTAHLPASHAPASTLGYPDLGSAPCTLGYPMSRS